MPAPPPLFPSPRGDKLCRGALARQFIKQGFRPLAGISCVIKAAFPPAEVQSFRPLAGISCVLRRADTIPAFGVSVPSRG